MKKSLIALLLMILVLSLVVVGANYKKVIAEAEVAYTQAPMLDGMDLPPVEERLPKSPKIITPLNETGAYGGTMRMGVAYFMTDERCESNLDNNGFFELNKPLTAEGPVSPNLAENWEWNDEGTELIVYLREGIKWSDGEPFTADDVVFFFEDVVADENVPVVWLYGAMYYDSNGQAPKVEKLDNYTVKFVYNESSFLNEIRLSVVPFVAMPKHHLSQFHPKYNPDSDYVTFNEQILIRNSGKISLNAWVLEKFTADEKILFTRNPYYWKVDSAGQQLPYFDKLEIYSAGDRPSVALGNITGMYDFDHMWVGLPHLSMFLEEQAKRDFSIGFSLSPGMMLLFNIDAEGEKVRKVIRDINVRRAISLAIDRVTINRALLYDQGVVVGNSWTPDSPYFQDEWGYLYSEYNIEEAKRILDEAVIIDRDGDGVRELPTGEKVELIWDTYEHDLYTPMAEMIVSTVKEIGIKLIIHQTHQALHMENLYSGNFQLSTHDFFYGVDPLLELSAWVPTKPGYPDFHKNAINEPYSPEYAKFIEIMKKAAISPYDERIKLGQEAGKLLAENVWVIDVGVQKRPYIMANRIGNLPEKAQRVWEYGGWQQPFRIYQVYEKYPPRTK